MAQDVTQGQPVTLQYVTEDDNATSEEVIKISQQDLDKIGEEQTNTDPDTNDNKYYIELVSDSSEDEIVVTHNSVTQDSNIEQSRKSPGLFQDAHSDDDDDDGRYTIAEDDEYIDSTTIQIVEDNASSTIQLVGDNDASTIQLVGHNDSSTIQLFGENNSSTIQIVGGNDNDVEENVTYTQKKSRNYNITVMNDDEDINKVEFIEVDDNEYDVIAKDTLILNEEAIDNPKQFIRRNKITKDVSNVSIKTDLNDTNTQTNNCLIVSENHGFKSLYFNVHNANHNITSKYKSTKIKVIDNITIKDSVIEKVEMEKGNEDNNENNTAEDVKSVTEIKEDNTNIKEEIIKMDDEEIQNNVQVSFKEDPSKTNESQLTNETYQSGALGLSQIKNNYKSSLNANPFYYKLKKPSVTYLKKVTPPNKVTEITIENPDLVLPDKIVTLKIREELKEVTTDIDYNSLIQETFFTNRQHFNLKSYRKKRVLYKCYACKMGFVYLNPFYTHLQSCHSKEKLNISLEITLTQLYLIASRDETQTFNNIPIYNDDGDLVYICGTCHKCVQDLEVHEIKKICAGCYMYLDCTQFDKHIITCTNYFKVTFPKTCLCKTILEGYSELEMHHKECSMGAKTLLFQCYVCKQIYPTASMLQHHQSTEHIVRSDEFSVPPGMKQCKLCKTFLKPFDYHDCPEEPRRFMCKHCLKQFTQKSAYKIHVDNLKEDVKCEYCSTNVKFECQLMRHLATKHDFGYSLEYVCNICDFRLESESQMKYHMLNRHTISEVEKQLYTYRVLVVRKSTHPTSNSDNDVETAEDGTETTKAVCKDYTHRKQYCKSDANKEDTSKKASKRNKVSTVTTGPDEDYTPSRRKSPRILRRNVKPKKRNAVKLEPSIPLKQNKIEIEYEAEDDLGNDFEVPVIDSKEDLKEVLLSSLEDNKAIQNDNNEVSDIDAFIQNNAEIADSFNKKRNQLRMLQCEYCDFVTKHSIALKKHTTNKHNQVADLLEAGLEKSIEEYEELSHLYRKKYVKKVKQDKPKYVCIYCLFTTVQKNTFVKHKSNCNEEVKPLKKAMFYRDNSIKCVCDCGRIFHDLRLFLAHLAGEKDVYPCPFCEEKLVDPYECASHVQKHFSSLFINSSILMENKTYKIIRCLTCEKPVQQSEFYMHYKNHKNDNNIREKLNEQVQTDSDSDEETKKNEDYDITITSANPYNVLTAEETMKIISILKLPLRYKRMNQIGHKIECLVCSKEIIRRNDYKRHLIQHLLTDAITKVQSNLGLKCQICNEIIDKIEKYKKHMRDHSYLPQYICSSCNKSFSDSSNFAKHKKVHNLNVLICDLCHKKFSSKTTFKQHLKTHDSQQPLVCKCKKIFYDKGQYSKHLRQKHSGEAVKYPCHLCTDTFTRLRDKWTHLWIVHRCSNYSFNCPFCVKDRQFRRYVDLKKHVKNAHQQQMVRNKDIFMKRAEQFELGEIGLQEVKKIFRPGPHGIPTPPILRL